VCVCVCVCVCVAKGMTPLGGATTRSVTEYRLLRLNVVIDSGNSVLRPGLIPFCPVSAREGCFGGVPVKAARCIARGGWRRVGDKSGGGEKEMTRRACLESFDLTQVAKGGTICTMVNQK
jgi:hypothetical protein